MRYFILAIISLLTGITTQLSVDHGASYSNSSVTERSFYVPDKLTQSTKLLPSTSHRRRANVRKRKVKRKDCNASVIPHRRGAYEIDEARMTVPQIIQKYNYPAEEYTVVTADGYHLTLHRIPGGVKSPKLTTRRKPAVFLMHGLFANSANFIINGPELSLGYLLADAGYDVWMGNARGTTYSRKHNTLNPANMAFWDFTFHEIGVHDLPTMIDFALNMTQLPTMFYIAHSQGTTVFYVMCSEHPEYAKKIRMAVHLAPVVYMKHVTSPFFKLLSFFSSTVGMFLDVIGIGEFRPRSEIVSTLGHMICKDTDFTQFMCTAPMFLMGGLREENFNKTRIPLYMGHAPAGCASRQVIHFTQLHTSGKFQYYDNGLVENLIQYKSMKPPSYKIPNANLPIILVYSLNDWLCHEPDVEQLYSELPNARKFVVADKEFTHSDYNFGLNARAMVHDHVIRMLNEYLLYY